MYFFGSKWSSGREIARQVACQPLGAAANVYKLHRGIGLNRLSNLLASLDRYAGKLQSVPAGEDRGDSASVPAFRAALNGLGAGS